MASKHSFSDTENHPLWALTNFVQYGLDCAVKESRQTIRADAPPVKSRKWLLDHVEGAVICLQLARDSVDTFISHG